MHLEAMRRSLKKQDPDLKVLQEYEELIGKGTVKKSTTRPEPEPESSQPSKKKAPAQKRQRPATVCIQASLADPADIVPATGRIG